MAAKKDRDVGDRGSHSRGTTACSGIGQMEASGGGSTIAKIAKLDFPWFKGQEDPLGWLNRCENFFRHQQTAEEDKVGLASYHLKGNAQIWFPQN